MASTNQGFEYKKAEADYFQAQTIEQKIAALKEMIRFCPKHKSSEKMLAELKTRLKKFEEKLEKGKKKKGSGKKGIKKEGVQAALIGLTSSGKSSLLSILTNARPLISPFPYTTKFPQIGIMDFEGVKMQIVDLPAAESEYFDQGIANMADILIIIINSVLDIEKISPFLEKSIGRKIIVFNKSDLFPEDEKRKISETLKSKRQNFILTSTITKEGFNELKKKIFESAGIIRIYTKEPGKSPSQDPVILQPNSTVRDVAEKIFHSLSNNVKEVRVTGPSSKFPNQIVSLTHQLKDKDIIEFHTK
jgi:hypothetical protein